MVGRFLLVRCSQHDRPDQTSYTLCLRLGADNDASAVVSVAYNRLARQPPVARLLWSRRGRRGGGWWGAVATNCCHPGAA